MSPAGMLAALVLLSAGHPPQWRGATPHPPPPHPLGTPPVATSIYGVPGAWGPWGPARWPHRFFVLPFRVGAPPPREMPWLTPIGSPTGPRAPYVPPAVPPAEPYRVSPRTILIPPP